MPGPVTLINNIQSMAANQTFTKRSLGLFNDDTGTAAGFFGAGKMMNVNIHSRLLSLFELGSLMLNPYQMFVAPTLVRGATLATGGGPGSPAQSRYYLAT